MDKVQIGDVYLINQETWEDTAPNKTITKLKGIILYYSGSGNTKLACQHIAKNLNNIEFDLTNMVKLTEVPDLDTYDIVGFATFTDFLGPPFLVHDFIKKIPQQTGKLAFVFNTYGFLSGKTLKSLVNLVKAKGFKIVTGHTLHTPENHVPTIVRGRGAESAPKEKDMRKFNEFISELNVIVNSLQEGKEIKARKVKIGFLNRLIPTPGRTRARKDMGNKFVDEALCNECGLCAKGCPYGAYLLLQNHNLT